MTEEELIREIEEDSLKLKEEARKKFVELFIQQMYKDMEEVGIYRAYLIANKKYHTFCKKNKIKKSFHDYPLIDNIRLEERKEILLIELDRSFDSDQTVAIATGCCPCISYSSYERQRNEILNMEE